MRLQLDPQHEPALGRFITSLLIPIGYSIIAVPTGIYTAELASGLRRDVSGDHPDHRVCAGCGQKGHDPLAGYCRRCGQPLPPSAG